METTELTGTAAYTTLRFPAEGGAHRRDHTVTVSAVLRQASSAQAPVAALLAGSRSFQIPAGRLMAEIRTYDGRLYHQPLDGRQLPLRPGDADLDRHITVTFGHHADAAEARGAVRAGLSRYILIDGVLWEQIGEPVIEVGQMGTEIFNGRSDLGAWRVFALTEHEAAAAAGAAVDDVERSFGRRGRRPLQVEIIIPSAFTFPTSAERISRARAAAAAEVARAQKILADPRPAAVNRASIILMKAANALSRQTGESTLDDEH